MLAWLRSRRSLLAENRNLERMARDCDARWREAIRHGAKLARKLRASEAAHETDLRLIDELRSALARQIRDPR